VIRLSQSNQQNSSSSGGGLIVCLAVVGIAIGQSNGWWGIGDWVSGITPNEWHFAAEAEASTGAYGEAILAEARKYDNERYVWSGGHPPSSFRLGSGVDCSGLINVAVFEATQINENNVAASFRNSPHWTSISFQDAVAGDIVYRLARTKGEINHVAIVVSNGGDGNLSIFEAATSKAPAALQVRQRDGIGYGEFTGALRFTK